MKRKSFWFSEISPLASITIPRFLINNNKLFKRLIIVSFISSLLKVTHKSSIFILYHKTFCISWYSLTCKPLCGTNNPRLPDGQDVLGRMGVSVHKRTAVFLGELLCTLFQRVKIASVSLMVIGIVNRNGVGIF